MSIVTNTYLMINSLFGKPCHVPSGENARVAEIFEGATLPFLGRISRFINQDSRVLIIGCNEGVEIEYFSQQVSSVVACDVNEKCIDIATYRTRMLKNVEVCLVGDDSIPFADKEFDVVFMHDVCEHLIYPDKAFSEYFRVLKNGGRLINIFAPLFYSPYGAHLTDALKMPWGHLLFGLNATVGVRNKYYPGVSTAESWADLGLNRITEKQYRKIIGTLDTSDEIYEYSTSKNIPFVDKIPYIRNLFIFGITHIFKKN